MIPKHLQSTQPLMSPNTTPLVTKQQKNVILIFECAAWLIIPGVTLSIHNLRLYKRAVPE